MSTLAASLSADTIVIAVALVALITYLRWRASATVETSILDGRRVHHGRWRERSDGTAQPTGRIPTGWLVYVMRDADGRVRYVGLTSNARARFAQHVRPQHGRHAAPLAWRHWTTFACKDRADAVRLEDWLIKFYAGRGEPLTNDRGMPR